jgi:DNA modification methylase
MNVEQINTDDLLNYTNNNKKHPKEQIKKIKASIEEFGFRNPVLIDGKNVLIAGHGRVIAARELGMLTVPCIKISDLSEDQVRAYRIMDNKSAESEYDFEALSVDFDLLIDSRFDVEPTGFDKAEIDEITGNNETEEVEADDINTIKTNIVEGDIFEIGNHRLMCGDSTDYALIKNSLIEDIEIDLCFTDPPYGMKKEKEGVLNDNLNYNDLLEFNKRWIPNSLKVLNSKGSWYCWGIDEPLMDIYSNILKPMVQKGEITFRNLLTWDKGNGQGQNADDFRMYPVADEKCLFVMKGVQGFNTNSDNYFEDWEPIRKYIDDEMCVLGWNTTIMASFFGFHPRMADHWRSKSQFTLIKQEQYERLQSEAKGKAFKKEYEEIKKEYEEIKKEYEEIKKEYYSTRAVFNNTHDNMNNVWHFDRTNNKEREGTGGHATPKPLDLCSRAIKSSSMENQSVIDLFGGSGSTMVACEQLNRKCYMMELDPKYCQVIINRMRKTNPDIQVKCINREVEWEV